MSKSVKILFTIILISLIFISPVLAKDNNYQKFASMPYKYDKESYYSIDINNKEYSCVQQNCYDLDSFSYNRRKNFYSIDMIIDLMNWNSHETYKSKYNDGYISHLIFKTSLHKEKITVKCIGFVVSDIVPIYKNGQSYSMYYDNMIVHMTKPNSIKKDLNEIIISFYNWINLSDFISTVKTLADN